MKSRPLPALLSLCCLLGSAVISTAQTSPENPKSLATFPWDGAAHIGSPDSAAHEQIIAAPPGMSGKILRISNAKSAPLQVNVLTIIDPRISADFYGLRGQVRYDEVTGDGYLEMWSSFPDGNRYFSRTLGDQPTDPMAKLSGTSGWRPIVLPFNAAGSTAHPEELTVNVILPGRGTLYLTPLELFEVNPRTTSALPRMFWAAGAVLAGLCVLAIWWWRQRYRSAEWRRMAALDT